MYAPKLQELIEKMPDYTNSFVLKPSYRGVPALVRWPQITT